MGHQQLYWSHPRKFGQGSRSCRVCSNRHGLIRKYGLNMCRQCFRQYAKDIGFIKVGVRGRTACCFRWGRRSWWFLIFSAEDNRQIFPRVVILSIRPRAFVLL
uniref:Small ribosomal subunit protein uS14 n=1 Tax=Aotus nancymaae TaxID=37293 RepID=A0A2K5CWG0_AOTNA